MRCTSCSSRWESGGSSPPQLTSVNSQPWQETFRCPRQVRGRALAQSAACDVTKTNKYFANHVVVITCLAIAENFTPVLTTSSSTQAGRSTELRPCYPHPSHWRSSIPLLSQGLGKHLPLVQTGVEPISIVLNIEKAHETILSLA